MTDQHPIKPPPELRKLWLQQAQRLDPHDPIAWLDYVATCAAQWGADQELEAIIELAGGSALPEEDRYLDGITVASLRAQRRPKPPSEVNQALAALGRAPKDGAPTIIVDVEQYNTILRALQRLKELEGLAND